MGGGGGDCDGVGLSPMGGSGGDGDQGQPPGEGNEEGQGEGEGEGEPEGGSRRGKPKAGVLSMDALVDVRALPTDRSARNAAFVEKLMEEKRVKEERAREEEARALAAMTPEERTKYLEDQKAEAKRAMRARSSSIASLNQYVSSGSSAVKRVTAGRSGSRGK